MLALLPGQAQVRHRLEMKRLRKQIHQREPVDPISRAGQHRQIPRQRGRIARNDRHARRAKLLPAARPPACRSRRAADRAARNRARSPASSSQSSAFALSTRIATPARSALKRRSSRRPRARIPPPSLPRSAPPTPARTAPRPRKDRAPFLSFRALERRFHQLSDQEPVHLEERAAAHAPLISAAG